MGGGINRSLARGFHSQRWAKERRGRRNCGRRSLWAHKQHPRRKKKGVRRGFWGAKVRGASVEGAGCATSKAKERVGTHVYLEEDRTEKKHGLPGEGTEAKSQSPKRKEERLKRCWGALIRKGRTTGCWEGEIGLSGRAKSALRQTKKKETLERKRVFCLWKNSGRGEKKGKKKRRVGGEKKAGHMRRN